MATQRTIADLIVRDPKLRGGRPILDGTGVSVRTIVGWYKLGSNAEEIALDMDLDLAHVYAALTYYHLNREEIEADIVADSEENVMKKYGVPERV